MRILNMAFALAIGFTTTQLSAKADDMKPAEARKLAKSDLEKMQGPWVRVYFEVKGEKISLDIETTAVYTGDILSLFQGGKVYQAESIITLDPSRKPKAVNTWNTEGESKDKTWPGIYQIDGDTMKVCFAQPGNERPTEFTTKKGTGYLYVEYKRKKTEHCLSNQSMGLLSTNERRLDRY